MTGGAISLNAYNRLDGVVANLLLLDDGAYHGSDGSSRSISNAIDRNVLVHLRRQSDAVVVGGNTARAEHYQPTDRFTTYVFTQHPTNITNGLHALGFRNDSELRDQVAQITRKHQRVLVEAGPSLLRKLIQAGCVKYLCLTVIGTPGREEILLRDFLGIASFTNLKLQRVGQTNLSIWQLN